MLGLLLIVFIVGGFAFMALWRYVVAVLYWIGITCGTLFAWRIVQLVDNNSYDLRPIFIGSISALVVCILCSGYIRHALILFYLRDTIERSKQAAQKGKLW